MLTLDVIELRLDVFMSHNRLLIIFFAPCSLGEILLATRVRPMVVSGRLISIPREVELLLIKGLVFKGFLVGLLV